MIAWTIESWKKKSMGVSDWEGEAIDIDTIFLRDHQSCGRT